MDSEVKLKVKGYDMITHSNGKELHYWLHICKENMTLQVSNRE